VSVTIPYQFATQSGNVPASELDSNFSTLATAANERANLANYYIDTGGVNALSVSTAAPTTFTVSAGVAGPWLDILVANNNTGATTLTINGGTAIAVNDSLGGTLLNDALLVGCVYRLVFDGTGWRVQGMRFGAGSSTVTSTLDFTVPLSFTLVWQVTGFVATCALQSSTGTSSSTQFRIGNIPSWLQPTTINASSNLSLVQDGAVGLSNAGTITMHPGAIPWAVYLNGLFNGWSATGTKGIAPQVGNYQTFSYLLI
jgi:hypothetical protein